MGVSQHTFAVTLGNLLPEPWDVKSPPLPGSSPGTGKDSANALLKTGQGAER